jgi:hypothetical protein
MKSQDERAQNWLLLHHIARIVFTSPLKAAETMGKKLRAKRRLVNSGERLSRDASFPGGEQTSPPGYVVAFSTASRCGSSARS